MIVLQVNVLISDDGDALLTDFGFTVAVNSSFSIAMSNTEGTKGTLKWMSPQILDGGGVSPEADVWAFGMTVLVCHSLFHIRLVYVSTQELFTRKDPFHLFATNASIITRIFRGGPDRPSTDDTCARLTDEWWAICVKCWEHEPLSRPTMSCIIQTITKIVCSSPVVMSPVTFLSLQMQKSQTSVPNGVHG